MKLSIVILNWNGKLLLKKFLPNIILYTPDTPIYVVDNASQDDSIEFLEKELTNLLGLKIEFTHKANNSGKMSILYKSLDQIQPVIDKLKWRPK